MLGHIKIRVDSLKGFRSYRGLKLAVRFPKNFKRPLAAKLWVVFEIVLGVQEWYGPPLSPCPVWWMRLRVPPGGNLYVLCLFDGHAFERLSLWTSLRHEGVGIQKQFSIIGWAKVCGYETAFNFVSTPLGGAITEC